MFLSLSVQENQTRLIQFLTLEHVTDVELSFSAGPWEGEALQAEKTGEWSLLCVEDQIL